MPADDGLVSSDDTVVTNGESVAAFMGDLGAAGFEYRQFFKFHTLLPDGASLVRATLQAYQAHVVGDPYGKKGVVRVDLVRFGAPVGPSFGDSTSIADVATLCTSPAIGLYSSDVTEAVRHEQSAGYFYCELRLRFHSALPDFPDGFTDYTVFVDGEDAEYDTGQPARLVLEYEE